MGDLLVEVPRAELSTERSNVHPVGADRMVEAMLPAGVLQRYEVVLDYRSCTLTLARPGSITAQGIPVKFHLDRATGLIAVDLSVDRNSYAATIDVGSAYTWFNGTTVSRWLSAHPDWLRGVGAVGASNMMMSGEPWETSGMLVRIPQVSIGELTLRQVGALGAPGSTLTTGSELMDRYSTKNAVPVIGWVGGNVLKGFQLTIDYGARTMYWLQQAGPDTLDQNQVGLVQMWRGGDFVVAAVARKDNRPTVEGVEPGDILIRVGDLNARSASWGAIYDALHGTPGETRSLVLDRNGRRFTIDTKVTAF